MRLPSPRRLVLVPVAALALAACGGGGGGAASTGPTSGAASSAPPASASSASAAGSAPATGTTAALPDVQGRPGEKPVIKAPAGAPGSELVKKVLVEGKGQQVQKGDLLVAHYLGQTWRDNTVFDNSYDRKSPAAFPIGVDKVIPGWDETLVGVPAGSRVLLSIPADKGYGAQGNPQAGIKGDDTLVFVVDVLASYRSDAAAEGTAKPAPKDLPQVTGEQGKPTVTIPDGASPPRELRAVTLVEGDGPEVEKGQLLVAQYVGLTWRDAKEFDSSWERGQPAAFPIGVGQVIPGWDETLVGVPAGSRVLLSIPPDKGYGPQGEPRAGIQGDDTLVFVVDVLGAHGASRS